jgi:hypothetical protein
VSTRTIIEINHDYLRTLREHPALFDTFLRELASSSITGELNKHGGRYEYAPGIYVLGQRHHTDPEWQRADI